MIGYNSDRYDESSYIINRTARPGEVWEYYTNNGFKKLFLIISNNDKTCSALNLVDECECENVEVCRIDFIPKYTDTKLLQYIYTSNLKRKITTVKDSVFGRIMDEIAYNLNVFETESTERASVDYSPYFDEVRALFGDECFENYCRCRYLLCLLNGDKDEADKFMSELVEYEE